MEACDKCRHRAYVRVTLASGLPLAFCGHHLKDVEDALAASGARIVVLEEAPRSLEAPSSRPAV